MQAPILLSSRPADTQAGPAVIAAGSCAPSWSPSAQQALSRSCRLRFTARRRLHCKGPGSIPRC